MSFFDIDRYYEYLGWQPRSQPEPEPTITGSVEVEAEPVDEYDVANRGYVDNTVSNSLNTHEVAVEAGDPAPSIGYRMGIRSAFVYWSGFEENVSGHGYFQVQIATDLGFSTILDDVATKANWTTFEGLTSGTTYYFRVRAIDAAGNIGNWSFTLSDTPGLTGTVDMQDGAVTSAKIATNLQSDNWDGSTVAAGDATRGWRIERNTGDAEFNNVTIRGDVVAGSLKTAATGKQIRIGNTGDAGTGPGIITWDDDTYTTANGVYPTVGKVEWTGSAMRYWGPADATAPPQVNEAWMRMDMNATQWRVDRVGAGVLGGGKYLLFDANNVEMNVDLDVNASADISGTLIVGGTLTVGGGWRIEQSGGDFRVYDITNSDLRLRIRDNDIMEFFDETQTERLRVHSTGATVFGTETISNGQLNIEQSGTNVVLQYWQETSTNDAMQVRMTTDRWILVPYPSGSADFGREFWYDFNSGEWQCDPSFNLATTGAKLLLAGNEYLNYESGTSPAIVPGGSTFAHIVHGVPNGHLIAEVHPNDTADSFSVVIPGNPHGAQLLFRVRADELITASGVYNWTTTGAAQVHVVSTGNLLRNTSSERYKADLRRDNARDRRVGHALLSVEPVTWKSLAPMDDPDQLNFGMTAESLAEALGDDAPLLVGYNDEGQPEFIRNERLAMALVPMLNEAFQRIEALENA